MELLFFVAFLAGLGILAERFGYDSRDGIARQEPMRRQLWHDAAAARRQVLKQALHAPLFLAYDRHARFLREATQAALIREARGATRTKEAAAIPAEDTGNATPSRVLTAPTHARALTAPTPAWRPASEALDGTRYRTLVSGSQLVMLERRYDDRTATQPHTHAEEHAGYVLDGRARLVLGNEARELQPGDSFLVPAGMTHRLESLGGVTVLESSTV